VTPTAKRALRKLRRKKPLPPAEPKEAARPGPSATPESATPSGSADAPEDHAVMLPGVPRPLPPKSDAKTKSAATPADDASPAPAAAAPEDSATHQIQEQFEFCAQLLTQGAYADHFDTCLCAEARQAPPYRGRRDFYADTLKKAETAGTLEAIATGPNVVLDGNSAKVTARWRTAAAMTQGGMRTEKWQLEDGLWCRNP
jgi:hypothetical protein